MNLKGIALTLDQVLRRGCRGSTHSAWGPGAECESVRLTQLDEVWVRVAPGDGAVFELQDNGGKDNAPAVPADSNRAR